jgi:hypothetical protein
MTDLALILKLEEVMSFQAVNSGLHIFSDNSANCLQYLQIYLIDYLVVLCYLFDSFDLTCDIPPERGIKRFNISDLFYNHSMILNNKWHTNPLTDFAMHLV